MRDGPIAVDVAFRLLDRRAWAVPGARHWRHTDEARTTVEPTIAPDRRIDEEDADRKKR